MEGWFNNFKLVVGSELKPDYIFCNLRMRAPKFDNASMLKLENGGCVLPKRRWRKNIPFGGGLAIKKSLVDEHNIQFLTGRGPWGIGKRKGSVYSYLCRKLRGLGLIYVELGKPCILEQDAEFANLEYERYYREVFGIKGRNSSLYKGMSKFESLRRRGGYTRYPDEYYKGSSYKIGVHYRNALNSKEGQAEWIRIEKAMRGGRR